tara:strand:+ start:128 stop:736 length:609 start_codon:yes stop_codon:yes gene_type:complete
MLKKEASKITGGLSAPGKMPEGSYNLPAVACVTGAKLRKIPGTPCFGCYAFKGRYNFPNVKDALTRRLESLTHRDWAQAMAVLIKGKKFFRWHDSGDLQGPEHLKKIFEVCKLTPKTQHWLPTQERKLLQFLDPDIIPPNLIIRLSNAKNDTKPGNAWPHWSTVVSKPRAGHVCPAPKQGNNCGSCRACWSKDVKEIQYRIH